ncbi:MAG: hypothetical protein HY855_22300, partial [Burkholderiales bacterium]|nr:hypothetical protein [Burkholderiales bacterium]
AAATAGATAAAAAAPDWRCRATRAARSAEAPAPPAVEWVIEPKRELNYAELHNHRPLFDRFELRNPVAGSAPRVHLVVELHGGPEPARYESELALREPRLNLQKRIQVPLTATLLRQAGEAMLSTLFVQLRVEGHTVLTDTHPLRLLPVDQWRDNASSGKWLPSFVLPRDPAVERVVSAAQRYVRVIRDDPSAGFEGYQSAVPEREDTLDNVDLQVEAIWATLLHEWQLGYINPPPSYSAQLDSQRLRTPSMIHATRVGTCIDLALLFAACLELVDIYPVIFLLDGHALPGYWRHSAYQTAFRAAGGPQAEPGTDDERLSADTARVQRAPWWTIDHDAVCKLIRAGQLAPLETVRLTEHCGFREARQAGVEALREKADFDSILDIATARAHQVTPLPIVGDRS